jgi:hypothetical protein
MIVAIVQFQLPEPLERATAEHLFLASTNRYRQVTGLIRKYYVLSGEGTTGGGVYLFDSRDAAEELFTTDWKNYIATKYGNKPQITYFECPVIVDNLHGEVIKG